MTKTHYKALEEANHRATKMVQSAVESISNAKISQMETSQQGPFLFLDCYPYDYDDPKTKALENPPWHAILSAQPAISGVIMKATDGVSYGFTSWFVENFQDLSSRMCGHRGWKFLIGGYHYLQVFRDPKKQADFYVKTLEDAGWRPGFDIVPIVDVEKGGERSANHRATAAQVVETTTEFATHVHDLTGLEPMLYGRGMMRDLSIESRMGCSRVWNPSYTRTMISNGLVGKLPNGKKAPWTLDDIVLWQYGGDGDGDNSITKLPLELGGKKIDVSVAVEGAKKPTWESIRRRLTR